MIVNFYAEKPVEVQSTRRLLVSIDITFSERALLLGLRRRLELERY